MKNDYIVDEINARVNETGDFNAISSKIKTPKAKPDEHKFRKMKLPFYLKLTSVCAAFLIVFTSVYFIMDKNNTDIDNTSNETSSSTIQQAASSSQNNHEDTQTPGASGDVFQLYEGMSIFAFKQAIRNLNHLEFHGYYFISYENVDYVAKENLQKSTIEKLFKCDSSSVNKESFLKLETGIDIYEIVKNIGIPIFIGLEENFSLDFINEEYLYRISLSNENNELLLEDKVILDKEASVSWLDENKSILPDESETKRLKLGMSIDEVILILGKPQRDIGYGAILFEFDLSNGKKLLALFERNSEKENEYKKDSDTHIFGTHYLYLTRFSVEI